MYYDHYYICVFIRKGNQRLMDHTFVPMATVYTPINNQIESTFKWKKRVKRTIGLCSEPCDALMETFFFFFKYWINKKKSKIHRHEKKRGLKANNMPRKTTKIIHMNLLIWYAWCKVHGYTFFNVERNREKENRKKRSKQNLS